MLEEYGDDINVLFVEVQGASEQEMEAFALKKKWLGNSAMWTTERPFDLGLEGIPACALIAPNGEIAVSGYFGDVHNKLVDVLEGYLKGKGKDKDTPAAVSKAVSEFNKGKYGGALAALDALKSDAKAGAAATAAHGELALRLDGLFAKATWCKDNGYLANADALVADLQKGLADDAERKAKAGELATALADAGLASEREAEKSLAALEKKLYADGPDAKIGSKLSAFAEKNAGTKAADRAKHLAKLCKGSSSER
jgi:hypothetical protein